MDRVSNLDSIPCHLYSCSLQKKLMDVNETVDTIKNKLKGSKYPKLENIKMKNLLTWKRDGKG